MSEITVKFEKPYKFEGKEYTEIDLSGIEKMTIADLVEIQRALMSEAASSYVMETTASFAQVMATKASGKPVELFKLMPRGKIKQVQTAILKYLNADQNNEDIKKHLLKFENSYTYNGDGKADIKGQTFDAVDLSGVGELNAMSESAAENRLTGAGFPAVNTERNYLYAAIIASMGTGYPVDFFTGLPICEAAKLRNAVDADFFE